VAFLFSFGPSLCGITFDFGSRFFGRIGAFRETLLCLFIDIARVLGDVFRDRLVFFGTIFVILAASGNVFDRVDESFGESGTYNSYLTCCESYRDLGLR
jgi:hypothetical protein